MRALLCPDSLKGVLGAVEAAAALAAGVRSVPGWEAEELPVADGGEGTAEALARALGGTWHETLVADPLGRPTRARFLLTPDRTAVVDCAEAVGLTLLAPAERDPLRASSEGLGELLLAVLACDPREVLVGIGGTATVDGGAGMLERCAGWPGDVPLRIACDVRNPLLGARGAAAVFGPQKGARPQDIAVLEGRLEALERLRPYRELPGAGAGGGLGAAFASLGAALVRGAELVLDTADFDARAAAATLVVSGEGRIDETTLEGKAPGEVARRCARLGRQCVLFGGLVAEPAAARFEAGGASVRALSGDPARAADDLVALGAELAARFRP